MISTLEAAFALSAPLLVIAYVILHNRQKPVRARVRIQPGDAGRRRGPHS